MNLKILTAEGGEERRVKATEQFSIRTGMGPAQTYPAGKLSRVELMEGYLDEPRALYIGDAAGGRYLTLPRGSTLSVGEQSWRVDDLASLVLAEEPKPVEPIRPYAVGTFRVFFLDGSSSMLEGVDRFEDLSTWEFHEGIAQPPKARAAS